MSDRHERREKRGFPWVAAFLVVVILVGYPLSLGPIYAAFRMDWISDDTFYWLVEGPFRPLDTLFLDGMTMHGPSTAYSRYIFWWCALTDP